MSRYIILLLSLFIFSSCNNNEIELITEPDYLVVINPEPSDALVHMTRRGKNVIKGENVEYGLGTQSILAEKGDWVFWSVRRDGYESLSGACYVQDNKYNEINIQLKPLIH